MQPEIKTCLAAILAIPAIRAVQNSKNSGNSDRWNPAIGMNAYAV